MKKLLIAGVLAGVCVAGAAYATLTPDQLAVAFYSGHTHGPNGEAIDAPAHSGGLDRQGCHNKSVPYHCHR